MRKLMKMILAMFLCMGTVLFPAERTAALEEVNAGGELPVCAALFSDGDLVFLRTSEPSKQGQIVQLIIDGNFKYGAVYSGFDTAGAELYSGMDKTKVKRVYAIQTVDPVNLSFESFTEMTSFDAAGFDTSRMTKMNRMFYNCTSLKTLDLSGFDTSNAETMNSMFFNCLALEEVNVSSFNTRKVYDMYYMFGECRSLKSVDVRNFDTANVKSFRGMFSTCQSLKTLDCTPLNTSNADTMESMFFSCSSLEYLDISTFDTSKVEHMYSMFDGCASLPYVDISSFNTSNVIAMQYMFARCSNLKTVYAGSGFVTNKVTDATMMFNMSTKLTGGNGTVYSEDHRDSSYARIDKAGAPGYFTDGKYAPPAKPEILYYMTAGTDVSLTWKSVPHAGTYYLYRKLNNGKWKQIYSGTSLSETVPLYGGTNYFKVAAKNNTSGQTSPDSNIVSVRTENPFTDVRNDANYYAALMWAYKNGIVKGTTADTFTPQGNCTRAQMAVMLWRMNGEPSVSGSSPFKDISSYSANVQKAILWCYKQGIVSGYSDGTYRPGNNITREQMAIMLWRMAGKPSASGLANPFSDLGGCNTTAKNAILWCYKNGIVKGSGGKYNPKDPVTRAQLVIMLYRYNGLYHLV